MLWKLFWTFFYIGAFTIGGGYAMLPLIRKDVVEKNGWLSETEFVDMIAIAQSAPGVLAVNSALIVGFRIRRGPGALAAALGATLPSFVTILLIAAFWLKFEHNTYLQAFMEGARPAVVALLVGATLSTAKSAIKYRYQWMLAIAGFMALSLLGIHPILAIIAAGLIGYFFFQQGKREESR